ncbi:MAG: c-type cytochrome [Deltaproteobacteria bacterium]|nr:c-type cytochrome [Deltaproteobacteria bacterium]
MNQEQKSQEVNSRKKIVIWLIVFLVVIAGTITYQYNQSKKPILGESTTQKIKQGERLFVEHCGLCHGDEAQGEDPFKPKGGLKDDGSFLAPALNGKGHGWHHSDKILFEVVKEGSIAEESPMREFKGKLSDDEIKSTIHYFKSLWPPEIKAKHQRERVY